ncbi:lysine-specific demethylase REF6 [Tanacetum coccineum]
MLMDIPVGFESFGGREWEREKRKRGGDWFAWHVEDHDFHSLNYMHMGAGKTWYGVPRDAAVAFEDVVRVHGYGGEINPIGEL